MYYRLSIIAIILVCVSVFFIIVSISKFENFGNNDSYYKKYYKINKDALRLKLFDINVLSKVNSIVYTKEENEREAEEIEFSKLSRDCAKDTIGEGVCNAVCDGQNNLAYGKKTVSYNIRIPSQNSTKLCLESEEVDCVTSNCPITRFVPCSATIQAAKADAVNCSTLYLNNGALKINNVNTDIQYGLVAFLLWTPSTMSTPYWSGLVGIPLDDNKNQFVLDNNNLNLTSYGNMLTTTAGDSFKAIVLTSKSTTAGTIVHNESKEFGYSSAANIGSYAIYMNGGMFGRNFIDNRDNLLIALTIYTTKNNKYWNGLVAINHFNAGNQTFLEISKKDITLQSLWDPWAANYIKTLGINSSDEKAYYSATILTSKNIFSDVTFSEKQIFYNTATKTYSIFLDGALCNRDFMNNNDQAIVAITIWTTVSRKYWTGTISICVPNLFKSFVNFNKISNNTIELSTGGIPVNYISVNNLVVEDGEVWYRANIVISKNNI
jgi:hypothetical protein